MEANDNHLGYDPMRSNFFVPNDLGLDDYFSGIKIQFNYVTVKEIIERIQKDELDLSLLEQRAKWKNAKKSLFFESILLNLPITTIFIDGSNDFSWKVVDGHKRIDAFNEFIHKKSFSLSSMELYKEYNGKKFTAFPKDLQRKFLETEVPIYIIQPGLKEKFRFNIYKRFNNGGGHLNTQEIRYYIYDGKARDFLQRFTSSKIFKETVRNHLKVKGLMDFYYVNRFIAFDMLFSQVNAFEWTDIDSLLNDSLEFLQNKMNNTDRDKMLNRFECSLSLMLDVFGDELFSIINRGENEKRVEEFEALSVVFSNLQRFNVSVEKIRNNSVRIREVYKEKISNHKIFRDSFVNKNTSTPKEIMTRFNITKDLILDALR